MIYCFDIDGTICSHEEDYTDAKPFIDVINEIRKLYKKGHIIKLCTARGSGTGIDWRSVTEMQLRKWELPYHELHFGKPFAHVYIDDKGMNIDEFKKEAK